MTAATITAVAADQATADEIAPAVRADLDELAPGGEGR